MADAVEMHPKPAQRHGRLVLRGPLWPHLLMALFGAGWAVSFDVGVRLYGAEIVAVVGLTLLRWQAFPARFPMLKKVLAAYALWVVAICLSDLVNGTALFDSTRHIATPIIGAASLVFAVSVLSRKPSALLTFLAATATAKAFWGDAAYGTTFADQSLNWASIEMNTNLFKVRVVPFLTPALIFLACWISDRNLKRATVLLLLASVGYFAMDARSSGLILFLSAMLLIMINTGFKPRIDHIIVGSVLCAIVGYFSYIGYVYYTIEYNSQGHNGQQLLRLENPFNPFNLLLQGRSEWLVWPIAFAERPLFGWGSWAEDQDGRFTLLRLALLETSTSASVLTSDRNYIPVHSLIGVAFVWSGLLGLVAALWFLRIILSMGRKLPLLRTYLLPAVVFLFFQVLWHYFFSPPQHVRLSFPVALAALIVLTNPFFPQRLRRVRTGYIPAFKDLRA